MNSGDRIPKLLCVDFEFQDTIYNPLSDRHRDILMTLVNGGNAALTLLENIRFDALMTTIVLPDGKDGIGLIDTIKANPQRYGDMPIAVITGLGGDAIINAIKERGAYYISNFQEEEDFINYHIDCFLSVITGRFPVLPKRLKYLPGDLPSQAAPPMPDITLSGGRIVGSTKHVVVGEEK